jgi:hypothetical protein
VIISVTTSDYASNSLAIMLVKEKEKKENREKREKRKEKKEEREKRDKIGKRREMC